MESNKQNATEWLFKQLWDEPKDKLTWYAILKQAKEMEKGQHSATYGNAMRDFFNKEIDFQKYYEKTYGGKDE